MKKWKSFVMVLGNAALFMAGCTSRKKEKGITQKEIVKVTLNEVAHSIFMPLSTLILKRDTFRMKGWICPYPWLRAWVQIR